MSRNAVGIIAPSWKVPAHELAAALGMLREAGFAPKVHPQAKRQHLFFAGKDEERAQAFFDFAIDPRMRVLWCARGGHGSIRLLRHLDRLTAERGIPDPKLLVGYSDATALLEYARARWGWSSLHAPMPAAISFLGLSPNEWSSLQSWVKGDIPKQPWGPRFKLKFAGKKPTAPIEGPLVGGNLTVWTTLIGTPYMPSVKNKILFFEDVGEGLYRIDRMLMHLLLSGGLNGARAIVLGNFQGCRDTPPKVLAVTPDARNRKRLLKEPKPEELQPLRKALDAERMIPKIIQEIAGEAGIPVAYGLPVGHGPEHSSLPIGATYRISPEGGFEVTHWSWLKR